MKPFKLKPITSKIPLAHLEKLVGQRITWVDAIHIALFLLGPAVAAILITPKMLDTYLPVGDDPGNWLKRAYAFAGVNEPLWEESVLSYPPAFPFLTFIFGALVGDMVNGLKLASMIALILQPITTGLLVYSITRRRAAAIIASFLTALTPTNYEMFWWGAYPNLLALALLPIAILYLLKVLYYDITIKNAFLFLVFSSLIALTHHLTSVTYAATLILATLLLLVYLRFREPLVYAILLAALLPQLAYTAYLLRNFYTVYNPISSPGDLLEKLLWAFKNPVIPFTLALLGIAGAIYLVSSGRTTTSVGIMAWIGGPLATYSLQFLGVNVDLGRLALLLGQPLIVLGTTYLPNPREAVSITRLNKMSGNGDGDGEGKNIELEISIDKVIPLLLVATLIISIPATALTTNDSAHEYYRWLSTDMGRYSQAEKLELAKWIKENTQPGDVIVTEYHIGRWLESYSNRKTLYNIPISAITVRGEFYRSLLAEAVMTSNLQLMNGYFRIDETAPLAPTFSPLIYVATSLGYQPIIYLDESFIRFNLTKSGRSYIEAPFDAPLVQTSLKRIQKQTIIEAFYQTISLRINKTITASPLSPVIKLEYSVETVGNERLQNSETSFFLAWGAKVQSFEKHEDWFRIDIGKGSITVTVSPKPSNIELVKDQEFGVEKVLVKIPLDGEKAKILFTLRNPSTQPAYPSDWFIEVKQQVDEIGIKYLALPKHYYLPKVLEFRSKNHEGEIIYIEDGLTRFIFKKAGETWSEAPYKANVTYEQVEKGFRETTYRTMALLITKAIRYSGDQANITYIAKPASGEAELIRVEIPLWISWGNTVYDVRNNSRNSIVIVTQHGSLLIASNEDAEITFGTDLTFDQPRILISRNADKQTAHITISIKTLTDGYLLTTKYRETTRPVMNNGDRLDLIHTATIPKKVYQTENLMVLELPKPEEIP